MVGGNVGGIPLQIIDGANGFLTNTVEDAAEKILYLLKHLEEAEEMSRKGKEHVKENFLITRHLENYLKLFLRLT